MKLNRDALAKASFKRGDVDVDGGTVTVRELTAAEVREYVRRNESDEDKLDLLAWLVAKVLVNEDGSRMYGDDETEAVMSLSINLLKQIVTGALKVSGIEHNAGN